jgi:hypothetical protein
MILVVSGIHLMPLTGLLGRDKLFQLYGIHFTDNNALILMQHRAVLFGVLGGLWVYCALDQKLHNIAYVTSTICVSSFLLLCKLNENINNSIFRVFKADLIALTAIAIGSVSNYLS